MGGKVRVKNSASIRNKAAMPAGKKSAIIALAFFVIFFASYSFAVAQLMALHGKATDSGSNISSGNLRVFIYDDPASGNLVYDSGDDFNGTILNGILDVMLGSGEVELDLNYGGYYYLDLQVDGSDLDFNGSERQKFEASRGKIYGSALQAGTVTSTQIATGTITNAQVASNANVDWNKVSKLGADLTNFN